jgi:hypothetical protein
VGGACCWGWSDSNTIFNIWTSSYTVNVEEETEDASSCLTKRGVFGATAIAMQDTHTAMLVMLHLLLFE